MRLFVLPIIPLHIFYVFLSEQYKRYFLGACPCSIHLLHCHLITQRYFQWFKKLHFLNNQGSRISYATATDQAPADKIVPAPMLFPVSFQFANVWAASLGLIGGSPVVHSVIVKRRVYVTLRDCWVSVQLTSLLSLSSPPSFNNVSHCQPAKFSQFNAIRVFKQLQPLTMCCGGCGGESELFCSLRYFLSEGRTYPWS